MLNRQFRNGKQVLTVPWGPNETYEFQVDLHPVKAYDDNETPYRFKEVFLGTFIGDKAPGKLKCHVQYWLKVINTKIPTNDLHLSAIREQHDLFPFKGKHFRKFLARNADAEIVIEQLRTSLQCDPLEHCCVVEPCYASLNEDSAAAIERMTVWERLEYVHQYIQAILDLRKDENRIAGRQILGHRDVKIPNGLILRGYGSFTVILVDMATILFGGSDVTGSPLHVRHVGAGPYGTNPSLMSPQNSPPELADPRYPMSEKADVFALGNMLASLFGYCDRALVEDTSSFIRNPIYLWHNLCAWPKSKVNPENKHGSSDAVPQASISIQEFMKRYEGGEQWEQDPQNARISWLEMALRSRNHNFRWENQTASPYQPSPEILRMIQILFLECTHVHPDKRMSLQDLNDHIEYLLQTIPEERNLANDTLYLADEAAYLYDLRGTGSRNIPYQIATRQAAILDDAAIRTVSYSNPWDQLYDPACAKPPVSAAAFRSKEPLEQYVSELNAIDRTPNGSLLDALAQLYAFYYRNQNTCPFSGKIRIFTNAEFTDACVADIPFGQSTLSLQQLRSQLQELADQTLDICLYSPAAPNLTDGSWLRWKPLVSAGTNAHVTGQTERPQPTPPQTPPQPEQKAPRPAPQTAPEQKAPRPAAQPNTPPAAAQPPRQAPQQRSEPEKDYQLDSHGLFFILDDKRYYVGRKKGR